jgi:hypothetical protein
VRNSPPSDERTGRNACATFKLTHDPGFSGVVTNTVFSI